MRSIQCQAIKTPLFHLGDKLDDFIIQNLKTQGLKENSVLAVTSKIVSLSERAIIYKKEVPSKRELVMRESDYFLGDGAYDTTLTIKQGLFIPAAGIDESNAEGDYYILFPQSPYESAQKLWTKLRAHYQLKNLGIIFTDSHTHPLRRGVTGIALAYWGFHGTQKKVGCPDLFGRELKMTYINVADALSVAAVYTMGEADESYPLAIIQEATLNFTEHTDPKEIQIPWQEDLYRTLYEDLILKEKAKKS